MEHTDSETRRAQQGAEEIEMRFKVKECEKIKNNRTVQPAFDVIKSKTNRNKSEKPPKKKGGGVKGKKKSYKGKELPSVIIRAS